jgi:hypothetical protein
MIVQNIHQLVRIGDLADGGDGKGTMMGPDDQRLRLKIRNAADAHMALHLQNILLKLRAEIGAFDIVDRPVKAFFGIVNHHTCPARTEMGMIVGSIKQVKNTVIVRRDAKKASHFFLLAVMLFLVAHPGESAQDTSRAGIFVRILPAICRLRFLPGVSM